MTIYDRPEASWRAASPGVCLIGLLICAAGLMLLPARMGHRLRSAVQDCLRPGLVLIAASRSGVQGSLRYVGNLGSGARRAAQLESEVDQWRTRSEQLEAEIAWLRSRTPHESPAHEPPAPPAARLLTPRLIEARVLGRMAQGYLHRQGILDTGASAPATPGDLVLEAPPAMIDLGAGNGGGRGRLVLAGRRVWGKVAQVQPRLSIVQRIGDAGYRDLVRVVPASGTGLDSAPRGVLEGTGAELCRLRLVPVTQSIAVGQWVVTDGGEGLLEGAFLYGRIERVQQTPGAAHWDIWVRPAVDKTPDHVAVLTAAPDTIGSNHPEARR